ncbi:DUF1588 domain-containing protein [Nannocystis pusilla]|uniref:DUF1588 domain-containing protein n=1 Tax=Nannocystis pusilla TaxID=889268 RepID=UPI003B802702
MTSPTRRGQFIRTRLLCDIILPPPPGVDTHLPPDDPDKPQTMKDKLQQHMSDAGCAGCHRSMDPLGLTLENTTRSAATAPPTTACRSTPPPRPTTSANSPVRASWPPS